MITWWNQNSHNRIRKIYLLIKLKYEFTRKLLRHLNAFALRIWVNDSYDKVENLENFESVLMFANDIDIVAQVLYIKKLLTNIKRFKVRIRSILLVWQLNNESELLLLLLLLKLMFLDDQEWVQEWMNCFLNEDKSQYVNRIDFYKLAC